jgi:hypothetical protein
MTTSATIGNDHGNTVFIEERSGEYVHGRDNQGRAWRTWQHDGRTETWPMRKGAERSGSR